MEIIYLYIENFWWKGIKTSILVSYFHLRLLRFFRFHFRFKFRFRVYNLNFQIFVFFFLIHEIHWFLNFFFDKNFSLSLFELFYELQFLRILNILILVTFQLPKVYFNKILFLARLCRIQPFSLFFAPTLNRLDLEPGHYIEKFETFKLIGPKKWPKFPQKISP